MICYDVTDRTTFLNLDKWFKRVNEKTEGEFEFEFGPAKGIKNSIASSQIEENSEIENPDVASISLRGRSHDVMGHHLRRRKRKVQHVKSQFLSFSDSESGFHLLPSLEARALHSV